MTINADALFKEWTDKHSQVRKEYRSELDQKMEAFAGIGDQENIIRFFTDKLAKFEVVILDILETLARDSREKDYKLEVLRTQLLTTVKVLEAHIKRGNENATS